MKIITFLCLMLVGIQTILGQDTTPYTEYINDFENVCEPEKASYVIITHKNKAGKKQGGALCYYLINGKQSEQLYFQGQFQKGQKDGEFIYFYNNGVKSKQGTYKEGAPIGTWHTWYPNKKDMSEYYYAYEEVMPDASNTSYQDPLRMVSFRDSLNVPTVIKGSGTYYNIYQNTKESGSVLNGKKNGVWKGNTSDGKPWYEEVWNDGKLKNGISYDKAGKAYGYIIFQQQPTHTEGLQGLQKELRKNFKYPKNAQRNGITSKVNVRFKVTPEGAITDAVAMPKDEEEIEKEALKYAKTAYRFKFSLSREQNIQNGVALFKSIYPELEEAAVNTVKAMANWNPGVVRGQGVNVYFLIPIVFELKQ